MSTTEGKSGAKNCDGSLTTTEEKLTEPTTGVYQQEDMLDEVG